MKHAYTQQQFEREEVVVSHGIAPKFLPKDSTIVRNLVVAEREALKAAEAAKQEGDLSTWAQMDREAAECRRRLREHDQRRDEAKRRKRSVTSIGVARLLRDHRFGKGAAACQWFQAGKLTER